MKKQVGGFLIFTLCCLAALAGCSRNPAPTDVDSDRAAYLTLADSNGRNVTLARKPERIIPLSSSFIDLLYAAGGKAVARPGSTIGNLPLPARALPEVGHVAHINLEQVVALRPDLVIGYQGIHEKLIPAFKASQIPFMIVRLKTDADVRQALILFGRISGTPEQAGRAAAELNQRIRAVVERLPASGPKIAILHASARNVTLQLAGSIAGNVANLLNLQNIAAGHLADGVDSVPFSMEKLVEGDPDVIFIAFTGDITKNGNRLGDEVYSNPAWNQLRAVRSHKLYYLPMELFLLNPGLRYDEAVLYMARLVYPELYGPHDRGQSPSNGQTAAF